MTRSEPWDWPDEPHRRRRIEVLPPELEVCIRVHVRDTRAQLGRRMACIQSTWMKHCPRARSIGHCAAPLGNVEAMAS